MKLPLAKFRKSWRSQIYLKTTIWLWGQKRIWATASSNLSQLLERPESAGFSRTEDFRNGANNLLGYWLIDREGVMWLTYILGKWKKWFGRGWGWGGDHKEKCSVFLVACRKGMCSRSPWSPPNRTRTLKPWPLLQIYPWKLVCFCFDFGVFLDQVLLIMKWNYWSVNENVLEEVLLWIVMYLSVLFI